jgi:hypothetical protein
MSASDQIIGDPIVQRKRKWRKLVAVSVSVNRVAKAYSQVKVQVAFHEIVLCVDSTCCKNETNDK